MQNLTQYEIVEVAMALVANEADANEILAIMECDYSDDLDYVVDYCKDYLPKKQHENFEDILTR